MSREDSRQAAEGAIRYEKQVEHCNDSQEEEVGYVERGLTFEWLGMCIVWYPPCQGPLWHI